MNNYALFCKKTNQLKRAIEIANETIALEDKYLTQNDKRKFITLINLATFYY